ncbi:MAG: Y-family DNA polymerase [Lentisphaeria bacterium]|nr:Y-family DNA polymerase [Lentisphaeria bacterium]
MKMTGLLDCNNFYVSCERVFDPSLNNRPVAVLSNNDGSCISRSNEFKALDLPKRIPYYILKEYARKLGIIFRSSNYCLYGDMSNRVMRTLQGMVPVVEQYSIDESFFHMDFAGGFDYEAFGAAIRQRVLRWTGIPCGIGFARTKTLAKIANHIAKKQPSGIFIMPENPLPLLKELPLTEVWGISWRLEKQLKAYGINNAGELAECESYDIKKRFNVVLAQTVMELQGVPCIPFEEFNGAVKQIAFSRSFSKPTSSKEAIKESVLHYTAVAASKLRALDQAAGFIYIYAFYTAEYSGDTMLPSGQCGHVTGFPLPLSEHLSMIKYITPVIENIIVPGRRAMKTGVVLFELCPADGVNMDFFEAPDEKNMVLAEAMDKINHKYGRNTIFTAGEGITRPWTMKQEYLSRRFTTNWNELPEVK